MSLQIEPREMWMAREPKKQMIPDLIKPVLFVFFSYILKDYGARINIHPGSRPGYLETCRELLYIQRGDLRKLPDIRCKECWGALPFRGTPKYLETPVSTVLVYDYDRCRPCVSHFDCIREVQAIQLRQRRRRLPDMQYNFLIGGMGRVYEGRGYHLRPEVDEQHEELEDDCLLIAMIGKDIGEEFGPHRKMRFRMMRGMEEFLRYSVEHHYIAPNFLMYNVGRTARQAAMDIPDHILKRMVKPKPRPKLMF